jgi:uncharacterized protein YneF (UPF0154 family)
VEDKPGMDVVAIVVSLGGMALVAALLGLITSLIGVWIANRTLREALKASPENLSMIADKLHQRRPISLEIWGLLGMATGAALAVAALIGDPEMRTIFLQASLLPGFIGTALFGQRWLRKPGGAPAMETLPRE